MMRSIKCKAASGPLGRMALAIALALTSISALANPEAIRKATELLSKGESAAAYELLLPHAQNEAGNPDFDYVFGVAALDGGHPNVGVFALERVLAVRPEHAQARAEIARGYLMLGELETSRKEFEAVKAANPPKEVVATIEKFMGTLDRAAASQGTTVSRYLEATFGHDTNVNGASSVADVAIPVFGGAVFSLSGTGLAQRDSFYGIGGGFNYRHAFAPDLVLSAGLSANRRLNPTYDLFDTGGIDGNIGLTWGADEHRWSATLQGGTYWVDNARYREVLGATGQWMFSPDANVQYSAYVQYSELSYPTSDFRNADRTVIGTAYARALSGDASPVVFAGAYAGIERARAGGQGHLGYDIYGVRADGQFALTPETTLFGSLSYENRNYDALDPLFLMVRKDDQYDLRLGATVSLGGGWTITPQLSHTDNRSNIVINKNERTQLSATLRVDF